MRPVLELPCVGRRRRTAPRSVRPLRVGGARVSGGRYGLVVLVVVIVVAVDQATKAVVEQTLLLHQSIPVIDGFFNITYVRNPGAAFGLFAGLPWAVRVPLFSAISVGALLLLFSILRGLGPAEHLMRISLAGVLGGAIGNLVDRVQHGEVIDFLDFYWGEYRWPAFNVADSFITTGVAILLFHSLRPRGGH